MTTNIDWPSELPQSPLLAGYRRGVPDNKLESRNSNGPPNTRRRTVTNEDPFPFSCLMTIAQHTQFKDFWNNTLLSGSLTFNAKDPETQVIVEMRAVDPTWERISGTHYRVSMQWVVQP